jgi:2-polyprenyl-3-methyl-5-hydroxy-6-metoxy-1,4-benzoquinol methylase
MIHPTCPLCGDRFTLIPAPQVAIGHAYFSDDALKLAHCRGCRVRFVNPRPSDSSLNKFYSADGYDCHDPAFGSDPEIRLDIVRRFTSPTRLCDFGAGAGRLLRSAKARGWQVAGIEPGLSRTKLVAQGFDVVSSLSELRDPVHVFTMVHVLEHLQSPGDTLKKMRKKLATGGMVYIEVPNADSLRGRLADSPLKPLWTHAPERYLAFPIHLFYFNEHSLSRLLKSCGYAILEMGTMGMGVEELFQPSNAPTNGTPGPANSHSNGASSRSRFQFAKNLIKRGFSRFRLGENLYVVAQGSQI